MGRKSKPNRRVRIEGDCCCVKCSTLRVKKWHVANRASLLPICEQFRKAYSKDDRTTLEELPTYLGFGRCICCGYTLLHLAVSVASKDLVSCYLERYTDLETRTEHGDTALHLACASEDPWFAEQLLIHKANVNAVDDLGCTPLQICLTRDRPSTAILKVLLRHKAQPNKLFRLDEDVEVSIDKMVKANARNSSGILPLYEAVHKSDSVSTRRLLQDGACPSSLKCYRRTLLQVACFNKCVDCVKALIGAGVDVNESDLEGRTALHYAAISNSKELVTLLASRRCDLWARDSDGFTAFEMSVLTNRVAVTKALLRQGVRCTEDLLTEALERRCTKVVLLLLRECRFRVDDTQLGQELFCGAVMTQQREVVDYLLSLDVEGSDDEERTRKSELTNRRSTEIVPRVQWKPNRTFDDASVRSTSRIQTRQEDKFSRFDQVQATRKHFANPPAIKYTKSSSSKKDAEVQSFFKALSKIPDSEPRKHAGSFVRFQCRKESDSKLTTYKGVFFRTSRGKENSKGKCSDATPSVDTFFKFYELCVA